MGCDVTNLVKTQIGTDGHHFGRSRWASKAFSLHLSAPDLFQSFSARHRLQLKICNMSYRTIIQDSVFLNDMKNLPTEVDHELQGRNCTVKSRMKNDLLLELNLTQILKIDVVLSTFLTTKMLEKHGQISLNLIMKPIT